jgi:sugar phosphate isomerase/epimerase
MNYKPVYTLPYEFRFGITSLHLDTLSAESSGVAGDAASLLSFNHTGRVRFLAQQGFSCIELNADVGAVLPHTLSPLAIEELAQIRQEFGITYTVHLPILSVEPSSPITAVRRGAAQAVIETIRATQPLAPEVYVYHATGDLAARTLRMALPDMAHMFIQRTLQNYARESAEMILNETGIPSRLLAIETIQFPFDLTLELAESLDTSMCFDTAHVLVGYSGPVELFEAFERAAPRLCEVHLNDGPWQGPNHVVQYGKDHLPLGSGDLDVARFAERLRAMSFCGPVIFELPLKDALTSLDVMRNVSEKRLAA